MSKSNAAAETNGDFYKNIEPKLRRVIKTFKQSKHNQQIILKRIDSVIEQETKAGDKDIADLFITFKNLLIEEAASNEKV